MSKKQKTNLLFHYQEEIHEYMGYLKPVSSQKRVKSSQFQL